MIRLLRVRRDARTACSAARLIGLHRRWLQPVRFGAAYHKCGILRLESNGLSNLHHSVVVALVVGFDESEHIRKDSWRLREHGEVVLGLRDLLHM